MRHADRQHFRISQPQLLTLNICNSRCILRGSEFGAQHANFIEVQTNYRNVAPVRELTVAGSALPEADWPDLRLARNRKPPAGILAEVFFYSELFMREDMYEVIVERPRRGKERDAVAARLRNDFDGPMRLGTRAGYGYRSLNENLAPLRRYLHAQIGRPWSKVFSEVCAGIGRRNTVQQHIHQHIRDFIAIDVGVRDGRLVDLAPGLGFLTSGPGISQELYVDPRTGLIRPNKGYRSWRHALAERRKRVLAEISMRRRVVDEHTLLLLLNEVWFRIGIDMLQ
jgi:hypothetical protein